MTQKAKARRTPRGRTSAGPADVRRTPKQKPLPLTREAQKWARAARDHAVELALVPEGARQSCYYVRIENPDGTVSYKYVCEIVHHA